MVDIFKSIKDSAESLMTSSGSLYLRSEILDDEGYTRESYEPLLDFKCRLSFETTSYELDDKNAKSDSGMTLFTSYELILEEGSLIKVRQNEADYYLVASKVKAYSSHREYKVKEVDRWL